MAKATILICDLCKTQEPARDTLTLRRGGGISVALDLCKRHLKEATEFFGLGHKLTKKPVKKPKATKTRADYSQVNSKIMELADSRPFFTARDVQKAAKVRTSVSYAAVKQMIDAGKIVATGRFAGRKLSKAS